MPSINSEPGDGSPAIRRQSVIVGIAVVTLAAAALRIGAARGDLWVDEIWSLNQLALARAAGTPDVWLALLFHDNTHALNTLHLALVESLWGSQAPFLAYRALAIATGCGAVIAAAALGWRRSPMTALIAALLVSMSYPMVHYSGEARGYGPMLLAVLTATWLLARHLNTPRPRTAAAFVIVCLLGLLSHLTFAVALTGLAAWTAWSFYRREPGIASTTARLVPLFGLQLLVVTAYASVAVNSMVIGGDNFETAADSIATLALYGLGMVPGWLPSVPTLICLGAAAAMTIHAMYRRGDDAWPLYLIILLACPIAAIVIESRAYVLPRYFLVCIPLALILAADGLSTQLVQGGWRRWVSIVALALFFFGNSTLLIKFLDHGRGNYTAAVALIAETGEGPVRITGYPNFSVGTMFRFHALRHPLSERLSFIRRADEKDRPADWFIATRIDDTTPIASELLRTSRKIPFRLVQTFDHWGLAGDTWSVYRRAR